MLTSRLEGRCGGRRCGGGVVGGHDYRCSGVGQSKDREMISSAAWVDVAEHGTKLENVRDGVESAEVAPEE